MPNQIIVIEIDWPVNDNVIKEVIDAASDILIDYRVKINKVMVGDKEINMERI